MLDLRGKKIWFGHLKDDDKSWVFEDLKEIICQQGLRPFSRIDEGCAYYKANGLYGYADYDSYAWTLSKQKEEHFVRAKRIEYALTDPELFPKADLSKKLCIAVRGQNHAKFIQDFLFQHGFGWGDDRQHEYKYLGAKVYFTYPDSRPNRLGGLTFSDISGSIDASNFHRVYYSQFILHNYDSKVQSAPEPVTERTGSTAIRFSGRQCRITAGQRYIGHQAGYRPGRACFAQGQVRGTIPVTGYSRSTNVSQRS